MDDLTREFLAESRENLDQLERDLLVLEKDPGSRKTLASVFRTIHTLKGTCGFLSFEKLETIAHAAEGLLSLLRNGDIAMSVDIATALLGTGDHIRQILTQIETTGEEGESDGSALVGLLTDLQSDSPRPARELAPGPERTEESAVAETTVRVSVALLDQLMNMVGELVLTRNQITQSAAREENASFAAASQRLNLITSDLQERVMKTRMEPIGNVWNKFPRLVRDLEQTCGKQVRLVCTGETTELDRTLLQAIRDPLTHLVRNAIDHGIETPAARKEAGKAPTGLLTLRAYHEGGLVNIEMTDDGAGIHPARVKQHAMQRGLLTEAQAARLSDREAVELIFLPGFSTAEKVSNVSGRGVGMDVVKTHIEKIGGVVDIETEAGKGTCFKIRIPLTLAIIPALTISCAGERYAIPQVNVIELLSLTREALEQLQGALVYRLRGSLLPILHLGHELQLASASGGAEHVQVVVVQAGERRFGLIVDEVHDAGEIVVKPLGRMLKGTPCLAGATIMGDGSVALIIDVFSLARRAELIAAEAHGSAAAQPAMPAAETPVEELLLFALGERRLAIPVASVARLEEFPRTAIESTGGRSALQYRGQILPLFGATGSLAHALTHTAGDTVCAIVYTERGRSAGLVVSRIDDIVRHASGLQRGTRRRGLLGSAVIDAHVTDVIDAGEMVRTEDPTFYEEAHS